MFLADRDAGSPKRRKEFWIVHDRGNDLGALRTRRDETQDMRDNDTDAHPTLAGTGVYPKRKRFRKEFDEIYQELTY